MYQNELWIGFHILSLLKEVCVLLLGHIHSLVCRNPPPVFKRPAITSSTWECSKKCHIQLDSACPLLFHQQTAFSSRDQHTQRAYHAHSLYYLLMIGVLWFNVWYKPWCEYGHNQTADSLGFIMASNSHHKGCANIVAYTKQQQTMDWRDIYWTMLSDQCFLGRLLLSFMIKIYHLLKTSKLVILVKHAVKWSFKVVH